MSDAIGSTDTVHGCADEAVRAIRPTTFIESGALSDRLQARVILASETFQHTGSFKFRAAYNLVSNSSARQFIAASSGNFGQALAYACRLLSKQCTVVMPSLSAKVKIDAVARYGGKVDLIDVSSVSRAQRVAQLSVENPDAQVVSPYDDELVIEGNASLGDEIARSGTAFKSVIVPIGGGGLASGIIRGLSRNRSLAQVYGAEPLIANDAARSLRAGTIIKNESEPQSIADGARTPCVGATNWPILQAGLADIIEVPEAAIEEAVRLLFSLANLKVEPTGALALAAILIEPERFRDQTVCCIVSGGNVDPTTYCRIVAASGA